MLNKDKIIPIEDRVLVEMYSKSIIKNSYKNIYLIKNKIRFEELQKQYNKKIEFKKILKYLKNKGFIEDHGKSLKVASVSEFGAKYIMGKYSVKK
ncbi:MAG: hypothetical protein AB1467_02480 [Candidatus Diapherotrites archaeon]